MDDLLPAEHQELARTVREFAADRVSPVIAERYARGEFPLDLVQEMADMGLFGLPVPEELGGMGGDYLALCVAVEELARVDSSLAITLEAAVSLGAMPLLRFGSEQLQQQWLPRLSSGAALGAFGLTEPGGGSDAGATCTTARLGDDGWTINGAKSFITNSGTAISEFVTVTAVTGLRANGSKEISAVLVPHGTPGFTVGASYDKVGWRCSDTHELSFSDAVVPESNLVGERGRGFAQFLSILDEGRVAIAALASGLAAACVSESVAYAKTRQAFGRPIGATQGVAFQIAEMEARAHTARLAWLDAGRQMAAGRPFRRQAAIAKLVCGDAAMANARTATQIHGGYGFTNDAPVGRFYRDAKILEIGEGTSEVQKLLIARDLGLPVNP